MEAKRQLNDPKCYKPIDNSIQSQTKIRSIIQDLYLLEKQSILNSAVFSLVQMTPATDYFTCSLKYIKI